MRWRKYDNDYLQNLDFVAFDTETTGIWAPANRIVELGAVKFRLGETSTDRFSCLVNPERDIPPEVVAIHGITNGDVQSAETIKPVLERFAEFCGPEAVLIAHNAPFDISFMGCESDRAGLPLMENLILDTVDLLKQYRPNLKSYSLETLMREFGLGADQKHRAADDAALVWKLFSMVAEDFPHFQSRGEFKQAFTFYAMEQWPGEPRPLPDQYKPVAQAIEDGTPLEILYSSNGQPPHRRVIWPRRIHNLRSVFYVSAHCELAEAERTFRLDRIQEFKPA